MKEHIKSLLLLIALVLFVASCGGAVSESGSGAGKTDSGSVNLSKTGQTTQYAVGDDGNLQKGEAWPPSRFIDNGNTMTDKLTGLMWLKDANCISTHYANFDADGTAGDGAVIWQHALDFVKGINSGSYQNCGAGYTDWRLPNRNEIRTTLNYELADSSAWLRSNGFINVLAAGGYWSSSTVDRSPANAWINEIGAGGVFQAGKNTYLGYVWPVRISGFVSSTFFAAAPKTGQATCYDASGAVIDCSNTGQDGEGKAGAVWPSQRFTTNTNLTILDNLTKLIWAEDAGTPTISGTVSTCTGGQLSWLNALSYVACLNINSYRGHNDWRLPNVNELQSLVHTGVTQESCSGTSCVSNNVWLESQGFHDVQSVYWSSTTYAPTPNGAWMLYNGAYQSAYLSACDKTTCSRYIWPVRGGQ